MTNEATRTHPGSGTVAVIIVASVLTIVAIGNLVTQWSRITSDLGFASACLAAMVLPLLAVMWGVRKARQAPPS